MADMPEHSTDLSSPQFEPFWVDHLNYAALTAKMDFKRQSCNWNRMPMGDAQQAANAQQSQHADFCLHLQTSGLNFPAGIVPNQNKLEQGFNIEGSHSVPKYDSEINFGVHQPQGAASINPVTYCEPPVMVQTFETEPLASSTLSSLEAALTEMKIVNEVMLNSSSPPEGVEKAAIEHKHAASKHEATCTWIGNLPSRKCDNPMYSSKVFLGGVPWGITAESLQQAFSPFGIVKIEFPANSHSAKNKFPSKAKNMVGDTTHCYGYVYAIFEGDKQVKDLLQACRQSRPIKDDGCADENYYYLVSYRTVRSKEVQVIPWLMGNSEYTAGKYPNYKLNNETTIFVGALHGKLNAEGLAKVMSELFGEVVYARVDTDQHKYPTGSGRVTFSSRTSFMRAVNAAFVEIKTTKFVKKVQIDPCIGDALCSICTVVLGPFFCRNLNCFKYYCSACWKKAHDEEDICTGVHTPVMRSSKNGVCTQTSRLFNGCYK